MELKSDGGERSESLKIQYINPLKGLAEFYAK